MSLVFARVILVFMLAPFSSYIVWAGYSLTWYWGKQPGTEPWLSAVALTSATVIIYLPMAVVVLGLWVYWTRKAVNTFPRLIISGLVCGGLVGFAFARHYGPLQLYLGLSVGAVVGITLALGTRWVQRHPARGA
ncbi:MULTISPECIES: hypothetical protein [Achromobacter]|uniref:Uncharacterized protein n=1 Tax=Achromobacter spanius TaxID=217203 RepID=A0ABY8GUG8_9BURK|nr:MULTISPECIES: hypothetical protein [Achromobacter]WAI82568.1 hypothetical protein N8Z00_24110 [Achromobacter spanius]WEX92653.1 hypothetical protein N3Z32_18710 [Achromobacter sp. SS2-2022]WFP08193.1 hypothetical protein P8T11_28550 [Achromobacter spanius]